MNSWLWFRPLGLALTAIVWLLMISVNYSQDSMPPRNVRIVRVNAGQEDDKLRASWSPPSDGNVQLYFFRWRQKPSDESDWGGWSSYSTITSTSMTFGNPSSIEDDERVDYQVEVATYFGNLSDPATATLRRVSKNPPPRTSDRKGASRSSNSRRSSIQIAAIPRYTCVSLSSAESGIVIASPHGLTNGIQCQQIDASGIGIQDIIDGGLMDAVDVWGNVQRTQICFVDQDGSFVFLDATTAPRTKSVLQGFVEDGYNCVWIDGPGSVILVPDGTGDILEGPGLSTPLEACSVTTTHMLRFRRQPVDGDVLGLIPIGESIDVIERMGNWFNITYRNLHGWISAEFVTTMGSCS